MASKLPAPRSGYRGGGAYRFKWGRTTDYSSDLAGRRNRAKLEEERQVVAGSPMLLSGVQSGLLGQRQ